MDEENVLYCPNCLSLQILGFEGSDLCYCGKCGCTDIQETDIYTWEKLYEKKYGKKHINGGMKYFR